MSEQKNNKPQAITDNAAALLELLEMLTLTQQGELLGRAKMFIESNRNEYEKAANTERCNIRVIKKAGA